MSPITNQLVTKGRRFVIPVGGVLAAVLATTLFFNHAGVHAAANISSPLDDNSVSSLVALDNAVESVAARVSPAVVNVAVTSKESAQHTSMGDQNGSQVQGLPPGFAQFFGPISRSDPRSNMGWAAALSSRLTATL